MNDKTSIIFTGDIGFDKYMDRKWDDEKLVSDEILGFLRTAKHRVINVEGPLSKQEKKDEKTGVLSIVNR